MWKLILGVVFTVGGPAAYALRGFLPGAGILHALKVAAYVAVLGVGLAGGYAFHSWRAGSLLTETAALEKCDMRIATAELDAKRKALDTREGILATRELVVELDEQRIASALAEWKEARDASAKPGVADSVCVPADDHWLRKWQGGPVAGRAGR